MTVNANKNQSKMTPEITISEEARVSATSDINTERDRQINDDHWDNEHDDRHEDGSLWRAAAFYVNVAVRSPIWAYHNFKQWPWGSDFFKPWKKNSLGNYTTEIDQERCLIKAGALILAEQDRLDRAMQKVITKLAEVQTIKSNQ